MQFAEEVLRLELEKLAPKQTTRLFGEERLINVRCCTMNIKIIKNSIRVDLQPVRAGWSKQFQQSTLGKLTAHNSASMELTMHHAT